MIGISKPIPMYAGPVLSKRFVNLWDLHKSLSSKIAHDAYVDMYDDWLKERGIKATKSIASKWANADETVVGYYFDDEQDQVAFKLRFGL